MSDDLKTILGELEALVGAVTSSTEVNPDFYIAVNQELIQYNINLGEIKANHLRAYLTAEAVRKKEYYSAKLNYISEGKKVGESEAQAEVDIFEKRVEEANAHADYQHIKSTHEAVINCVTVISQKIKLLTQEMRFTGN